MMPRCDSAEGSTLRLWSVLDLLNYFNVQHLLVAIDGLEEVLAACERMEDSREYLRDTGEIKDLPEWQNEAIPKHYIENTINPQIGLIRERCVEAELSTALTRIDGRLRVKLRDFITFREMMIQIRELREDILDDLRFRRFVFIPDDRAKKVDAIGHDWADVWRAFPETKEESRDAVECFGLDKNTACVFHLMRVAELGLRAAAKSLGIRRARNKRLEWAEWQDILKEMNREVEVNMASKRAGPQRDELLEFYRGAIGEFYAFKDAYRNHVMHMRNSYDAHQAASVLSHVLSFMNRLSARINSEGKRVKKA